MLHSKCVLTPQYKGLEALYETYRDQGFEVLAFRANDFGAQEPGTAEEITEFCKLNYGVTSSLFAKAPVTGLDKQRSTLLGRRSADQAAAPPPNSASASRGTA